MIGIVDYETAFDLMMLGFPQCESKRCYFIGDDERRMNVEGDVVEHSKTIDDVHLIDAPDVHSVHDWLFSEKGFIIETSIADNGLIAYRIYKRSDNTWEHVRSPFDGFTYDTPTDAISNAVYVIVQILTFEIIDLKWCEC